MLSASLLTLALLGGQVDPELFRSHVRPTEPLTPAEQRMRFRLPPGFEVELVAAEPDIAKPMNMAFDTAGRLWVTSSLEYPWAAEGEGRDGVQVIDDADGDGRLDRVRTFADRLNIPIGVYPYRDGVVVYSIPNIYWLRDTDGDGVAETREVLYGPLGTPRDTHGMQNAFRRGFDGWLYVNHGFNNDTTVEGRDGSRIELHSGNTYRVRLDGSRVEQFTWGQVNPFGSALLPDGDLITSDCHSKPLSLLLRGGYYPSFGKPHDGLGFVPDVMTHGHESTAIDGACSYDSVQFPQAFRGNLFVGNVMTSKVNRDLLIRHGASVEARETEDFLSCDDPWFRPVDVQLGPDGALYVADFYNRIIGHYEVPLTHPQRDRTRGRIWRIWYRGDAATADQTNASSQAASNLATADVDGLIEALAEPNLRRRLLATDALSDRIGAGGVERLRTAASDPRPTVRLHARWALHRLGALTEQETLAACADQDEVARIHGQRLLAERSEWTDSLGAAALHGLADQPRVRRAAADALSVHPVAGAESALLTAFDESSPDDVHLKHMLRLALRRQWSAPGALNASSLAKLTPEHRGLAAQVALAVPGEDAARFLVAYARGEQGPGEQLRPLLSHAAAHLPTQAIGDLAELASRHAGADLGLQADLLETVRQRLAARGADIPAPIRDWAVRLAPELLASATGAASDWESRGPDHPWGLEPRKCADGRDALFLSSLPGGEKQLSTLRSRPFTIPAKLTFYVCGHLGLPDKPAVERNRVVLRLESEGRVIAETLPPRNDLAQLVTWELSKYAGQQGRIEVVDGIDLSAYAWLAVSRFEPAVVAVPTIAPAEAARRQRLACELVATWRLSDLRPELLKLLAAPAGNSDSPPTSGVAQEAAARALAQLDGRPLLGALAWTLGEPGAGAAVQDRVRKLTSLDADPPAPPADATPTPNGPEDPIRETMRSLPGRFQQRLARELAGSAIGAARLLALVEQGAAAAELLRDEPTRQALVARDASFESRVATILESAPPQDAARQALIEARVAAFRGRDSAPSLERGLALFNKHCAACHQLGGQGKVVGPQLDGIGGRGLERVVEDVLDPARNVDQAFRSQVLALQDGQVLTGLERRREGETLVIATDQGKEVSVPLESIARRRTSTVSIMPNNFGEVLQPEEFLDLAAFLLASQRREP